MALSGGLVQHVRSVASRSVAAGVALFVAAVVAGCHKAPPPFQMPPSLVTVVDVKPQTIPALYQYQGVAQAFKHVDVRANVTGFILSREFVEGTDVAKGQALYQIETPYYQGPLENAKGQLADAEARAQNAKVNLDRLKALLAERAVAQKDYDDAEQAYRQAVADSAAAAGLVTQADKNFGDTKVRSLIAGRVGRVILDVGNRVSGSTDIMTTVDQVDPIYVNFSPPQEDILAWRREIAAKRLQFPNGHLRVRAVLADGTYNPQDGTINFADINVDSATGAQRLRATFPNRDHILLPNQYVRVELLDVKRDSALMVPQRAVQQSIAGPFVYLVGDSNKVAPRPVQTGQWVGAQWIITDGIKAGDKVVVDGTQKIFPGAKVNPSPYNEASDTTLRTVQQDLPAAPSFQIVPRGNAQ
jgi:membrane fusion protein (multidrug efflux system)